MNSLAERIRAIPIIDESDGDMELSSSVELPTDGEEREDYAALIRTKPVALRSSAQEGHREGAGQEA